MALILPESATTDAYPALPQPGVTLTGGEAFQRIQALSMVSKAGFHGVELGGAPGELGNPSRMTGLARKDLLKTLRETGLSPLAIRSDVRVGLASGRERRAERDRLRAFLDLGHGIACPLIVVQASRSGKGMDAARYALDAVYEAESSLEQGGLHLAVEAGGDAASFLADPEARDRFLAESPAAVGLALVHGDLAAAVPAEEDMQRLSGRVKLVRLSAAKGYEGSLGLDNREMALKMIKTFRQKDFRGSITVLPGIDALDLEELRRLCQSILSFFSQAMMR
ncbi:MAG: hypothetical protein V1918_08930 [Planctomycetota bacterium]